MAGTLNNWTYTPMFKIEEFIMMLDRNFKEPFDELKESGAISQTAGSIAELEVQELAHYVRHRTKMVKNYRKNFMRILHGSCMKY